MPRGVVANTSVLAFGPFELDLEAGSLRRGGSDITLRPKAWQMLVHLAERPGVLVPTEELYTAVWGDTAVTPNAMTNVMGELRRALGDGTPPEFIETIRGRGYRFIAALQTPAAPIVTATPRSIAGFIGRDAELAELREAATRAASGARQAVFVSGEPGIGKTTLVEQFAESERGVVRVQCSELAGASEAWQPFLSLLDQLLRSERRDDVLDLLHRLAPTWLVQIPGLLAPEEAEALAHSLIGVGPARMLRDGATLFEQIAKTQPLIVVFEDLHWADHPTTELLSTLLQRRESTRLLAVATYRPIDALVHSHPVSAMFAALQGHDNVRSLPLSAFSLQEVRRCLANELMDDALAARLAPLVGRHSGGNPLFVKAVGRQLREEGWLRREAGKWELTVDLASFDPRLPDDLRELIELQVDGLPDDSQRLLEAASIASTGITVSLLRDALRWETERIEDTCHELTQRSPYLRRVAGHVTDSAHPEDHYGFTHALYLRAFRDRTTPSRRRHLHRSIGEYVERAHAADPSEVAARLASHFEGAVLLDRASHYRELAASVALRRLA